MDSKKSWTAICMAKPFSTSLSTAPNADAPPSVTPLKRQLIQPILEAHKAPISPFPLPSQLWSAGLRSISRPFGATIHIVVSGFVQRRLSKVPRTRIASRNRRFESRDFGKTPLHLLRYSNRAVRVPGFPSDQDNNKATQRRKGSNAAKNRTGRSRSILR